VASGAGYFLYYLTKMGFSNLQAYDTFTQLPICVFGDTQKALGVTFPLNDLTTKPVVSNLSGLPFIFVNPRFGYTKAKVKKDKPFNIENLELLTFYAPVFDAIAEKDLPELGFKFLCKDQHGFTTAYCRNDKYDEFSLKIEPYKVVI
jgi:hypothetical protein